MDAIALRPTYLAYFPQDCEDPLPLTAGKAVAAKATHPQYDQIDAQSI